MVQEDRSRILVLEGVGFFFSCGHGYIKAVEADPCGGTVETRLICPRCYHEECLCCGGCFTGRWLDFCALCQRFWNFEAWVDYAIANSSSKIRCRHGIILVPAVDEEPVAQSPWPDLLTLGEGDVELERTVRTDGALLIDVSTSMKVMDQVDGRGKPDNSGVGDMVTWNICSVECDATLGTDADWVPPEQPFDFSWFQGPETTAMHED
ncbi:hypothetical protein DL765_001146 [Monosporascus sp. GIB2]|nr:hypothetical protein DL765_001146 [Monosporascus sp. GIB2]